MSDEPNFGDWWTEAPDTGLDPRLASPDQLAPSGYPRLLATSAAGIMQTLYVPSVREPVEYVTVRLPAPEPFPDEMSRIAVVLGAMYEWNAYWEAGQLRHAIFADKLPYELERVTRQYKGVNIQLVGLDGMRRWGASSSGGYEKYAPLYHLLPARVLERHSLPLLSEGHWPPTSYNTWQGRVLPENAGETLKRAFAGHIWKRLQPRGSITSFRRDEPIRTLAHDLDFWLPPLDAAIQASLVARGHRRPQSAEARQWLARVKPHLPSGLEVVSPLEASFVWHGEAEAEEMLDRMIEEADRDGRLRELLAIIRSHRADEDFERAMRSRESIDHHRRWNHTRVRGSRQDNHGLRETFIEISGAALHGPESELVDGMMVNHFVSLLDPKKRRIFHLLVVGHTTTGIAQQLGYANHGGVSKQIDRIRELARQYFER